MRDRLDAPAAPSMGARNDVSSDPIVAFNVITEEAVIPCTRLAHGSQSAHARVTLHAGNVQNRPIPHSSE